MLRALLVVNPHATATTARVRDVLARALASDLKLEVAETQRRGHAVEIASQAASDGLDVVVVLGGDGTVNEVANGLAGTDTAMGVVPGGSTNVFARALGLPNSPVEATGELLDALRQDRRRSIGLGRANDRWFTFCLGVGIDAEVVKGVEGRRHAGRRATPALYVRTALRHFYSTCDRKVPALTLEIPGRAPVDDLFNLVVANGRPWTYLGGRAVDPCPEASFETGLDLVGLRSLSSVATLSVVRQMLSGRGRIRGRRLVQAHDLSEFTLRASRPIDWQVDGDHLGTVTELVVSAVPDSLTVLA